MKQNKSIEILQATSHQKVNFIDGMIVIAEDLQDASHYPLDVFKTLIRAFFGCGIVCGLNVKHEKCDPNKNESWHVKIEPGVALDCNGHPLELCKPVLIDLQEPYVCDPHPPECVCIAIKGCTSEEAPRSKSGCGEDKNPKNCEPSRIREQVLIKVFDPEDDCERPKNICMCGDELVCECKNSDEQSDTNSADIEQTNITEHETNIDSICKCLKSCSCKKCCSDSWVLLACIKLGKCGVECVLNEQRKYVKPIQCVCPVDENDCTYGESEVCDSELLSSVSTGKPAARSRTKAKSVRGSAGTAGRRKSGK